MQWQWKDMTARAEGDVVVVDIPSIESLHGDDDLPSFVIQLVEGGNRKFVLNILRLTHLDSTGLGEIVRAYTTVARRGGHVKLVHASPRMRQLFDITRLSSILESFPTEEEAIRSYRA
ncbi:MAG: anti-sigma factor antagonist [Acidobacteria bacterium]|nr:MAG: anti-sigma factor antagonist [Acidobacteriota bacterium]